MNSDLPVQLARLSLLRDEPRTPELVSAAALRSTPVFRAAEFTIERGIKLTIRLRTNTLFRACYIVVNLRRVAGNTEKPARIPRISTLLEQCR